MHIDLESNYKHVADEIKLNTVHIDLESNYKHVADEIKLNTVHLISFDLGIDATNLDK
jgi:hypothetical protein